MINEFFQLTERKQKSQIQLQHVSETLQSSTHSTTAEELVLVKQQVHALHQQLEEQNHLLLDYQKKEEELKTEITFLQEKIKEQDKKLENNNIQELEKQAIIEDLQETIKEEGNKSAALQNELETADKLVGDLKEQIREKDQETQSLKLELANCNEKEKHYILEIEEFKGRVEELQKKDYKDNHTDTGKEQSTERETRRKVDHLQVELDEMYGREIMHMKEELIRHTSKMEDLKSHHEGEMETILASYARTTLGEDKEPIQVLIGRLQKALSEECCSVSKSMQAFLDEHCCPLNCEMNIEEKVNSFVYHAISRVTLQEYRYKVEEFQEAIQNLLSKVTDEHNKFVTLQMQLSKFCEIHRQQTDGAKLEFAEENVAEEESGILSVCSQAGLESIDTDIRHESELSSRPEGEDSKNHEKQLQVLESPVDTLEQQLKATEAHYGTEIPMVQGSIETIHGPSAHPSVDSMLFKDSVLQKTVCRGNCRPDHVIIVIETEEMLESFPQNQENTESLWCLDDLNEHQQEQPRSREQPAVHLNKAESIIDGNLDERILLEREIQENACTIDHLEHELLCMSGRVSKLEEEQQQIQEERALLSRQKEAMGAGAGPVEQQTLNKGHMDPEQLHTVPMESVGMTADELQADALKPEDVSAQDSSELLKTLTPVGGLKQSCKGYRSLETQLLTLEQGKSKPELLQKKINILQNLLVEKIAEATVNQAQMEAFQQYVKYFQEKRTSEPEMRDRHNVNPLKGDNTGIDIFTLTLRLAQLENQVAEMRSSFIKEKQQCEITEKRVSDIEKVLKLQMPLGEDTTKRQEIKENERSLQDLDISETRGDLIHASGDRGFLDELEAHGAGSVSHKERDLIKNKQTAMKSFWVVNMESLWNVSIKLTEGLRKLKITH
ncbi:A-kinase anchor protein 9-like isoform X2 [Mesocricetus auratus]|uniref:A-kinase anchor protein 9-like isoform X2 n=1 Tax=Mesocricetus auratus TaxID=10036 RepID=A0ABM2X1L4_MESAU|nr:A-kinase anchor protein 9-like isoform X2 [Mesocricetus auratus]